MGMRRKVEERLRSGKLVRVKVEHHDFIERIEISGDFYMHPPEALREVEKTLIGVEVESGEEGIAELIEDTIKEHHAVLEGASAQDIAKAVKKAVG
jgi:lipoate-protein ligase A